MTVTIALSGGIGSGKSTVGRMFEELGATLIDADEIVHEVQSAGSPVLKEIAAEFGPDVILESGGLDRQAIADIVFRDAEARAKLGRIVHPPVIAEMVRRLYVARERETPLAILDIPLLFEGQKAGKGAAALLQFDATVVVWATEEQQVERQLSRNDYDREEALRRIRAQLPLDEKRTMADHTIDNSGPLEATERQVREFVATFSATTS